MAKSKHAQGSSRWQLAHQRRLGHLTNLLMVWGARHGYYPYTAASLLGRAMGVPNPLERKNVKKALQLMEIWLSAED